MKIVKVSVSTLGQYIQVSNSRCSEIFLIFQHQIIIILKTSPVTTRKCDRQNTEKSQD